MSVLQPTLWKVFFCAIVLMNGASPPMLPDDSLLRMLDQLAATGDIEAYSEAIARLGAVDKLHDPLPATLKRRFAQDELRVRAGKQARVPELAVSMAFNRIAEDVGAPQRTNVDTVHSFRKILEPHAPHLITLTAFPESCNPGEALFLVYMMIANDGALQEVSPNAGQTSKSESVRVSVKSMQQPPAMTLLVAKFVTGKQDAELLQRLEGVLSLLRL